MVGAGRRHRCGCCFPAHKMHLLYNLPSTTGAVGWGCGSTDPPLGISLVCARIETPRHISMAQEAIVEVSVGSLGSSTCSLPLPSEHP